MKYLKISILTLFVLSLSCTRIDDRSFQRTEYNLKKLASDLERISVDNLVNHLATIPDSVLFRADFEAEMTSECVDIRDVGFKFTKDPSADSIWIAQSVPAADRGDKRISSKCILRMLPETFETDNAGLKTRHHYWELTVEGKYIENESSENATYSVEFRNLDKPIKILWDDKKFENFSSFYLNCQQYPVGKFYIETYSGSRKLDSVTISMELSNTRYEVVNE